MLTTTHGDTGGHKTTLRTVKPGKTQMWWTCMNTCGRNEANSKTAGCRFDSCRTCPSISLISCGLQRLTLSPLTAVVTAVRAADVLLPCTVRCAALEPNTCENWYASTYWAPTIGMISTASNALMNTANRTASVSKTAGHRCACCPTCPENPEFTVLAASWTQRNVCALTPISYHQEQHRRYWRAASQ
jgi:hypothetical protein